MAFELASPLEKDTLFLADLPLSRVLLMNDSRYPWLILVPRRDAKRDITDLLPGDQQQLLAEINQISSLIQKKCAPDKLNLGALGNVVPQLHIHLIGRFKNDEAWPAPVWGRGQAVPYADAAGAVEEWCLHLGSQG